MSAETNARTAKALREEGYLAEIVERHIPSRPFPKKADLYGWCDVLGIHPERRVTLGVQACRASDYAQHVRDLCQSMPLRRCIEAGWVCELWVWRSMPFRGGFRWEARRMSVGNDGAAIVMVELVGVGA